MKGIARTPLLRLSGRPAGQTLPLMSPPDAPSPAPVSAPAHPVLTVHPILPVECAGVEPGIEPVPAGSPAAKSRTAAAPPKGKPTGYRLPELAELALQLRHTPPRLLGRALDGLERLLAIVEPRRDYPFEWVQWWLTGYERRGQPVGTEDADAPRGGRMLPGRGLSADLTRLACELAQPAEAAEEPVYTLAQAAKRLGVSEKTVHRWRRRGLPARPWTYHDGRVRVGIRHGELTTFLEQNAEQVARAAGLTRLSTDESTDIVGMATVVAAELAAAGKPVTAYQVARVVAERVGRAVETIRYTLYRHDERHPRTALFPEMLPALPAEAMISIWRVTSGQAPLSASDDLECGSVDAAASVVGMDADDGEPGSSGRTAVAGANTGAGQDISGANPRLRLRLVGLPDCGPAGAPDVWTALSDRWQRPVSVIRQAAAEGRLQALLARRIDFIDNPEFRDADAGRVIRADADAVFTRAEFAPTPAVEGRPGATRVPAGTPAYLAHLYGVPLLTAVQERMLFRLYNYLKFAAAREQSALAALSAPAGSPDKPARMEKLAERQAAAARTEALLAEADAAKNRLIQANLRLVVSVAKGHAGPRMPLFELISDGNVSLMRAVEKFDYARGTRFSTYAVYAISRDYARILPEAALWQSRLIPATEAAEADRRATSVEEEPDQLLTEAAGRLEQMLDRLSDKERSVIVSRFGLTGTDDATASPMTLEQLGRRLGVSGERVRQIEKGALAKLRTLLTPGAVSGPTSRLQ